MESLWIKSTFDFMSALAHRFWLSWAWLGVNSGLQTLAVKDVAAQDGCVARKLCVGPG